MTTRRGFLARGLRDSTLVAGPRQTLPGFLAHTAHAAGPEKDGRILVVVQLDGGNDGINTVVPFRDEGYAKYRKALRLPEKRLIPVNGEVGLHPAMARRGETAGIGPAGDRSGRGVSEPEPFALPKHGDLAIGPARRAGPHRAGLGRPRPRRGSADPRRCPTAAMLIGSDGPPSAIRGRRSVQHRARPARRLCSDRQGGRVPGRSAPRPPVTTWGSSSAAACWTPARPRTVSRPSAGPAAMRPESELARRLKLTARLIRAGLGMRVYHLEQGGYDTHGDQLPHHAPLLEELSARSGRSLITWPRRGWPTGSWCWPSASSAGASPRTDRRGPTMDGRPGRPGRPTRPAGAARGLPEPHRSGSTAT